MPRILISFILIGLSVIFGVLFLWPRYQELNNLWAQIKNKELEIQYQNEYYQELNSLSQKLEERQEGLAKIDSALPSKPRLPSLLKFFQKTASENGLILTSAGEFSIKSLPEANLKEIQNSLNLSGSYPALKNFLRALEKSARLIEVDSISFSASRLPATPGVPEARISEIFNFQLKIKTYSR